MTVGPSPRKRGFFLNQGLFLNKWAWLTLYNHMCNHGLEEGCIEPPEPLLTLHPWYMYRWTFPTLRRGHLETALTLYNACSATPPQRERERGGGVIVTAVQVFVGTCGKLYFLPKSTSYHVSSYNCKPYNKVVPIPSTHTSLPSDPWHSFSILHS